MITEPTTTLLIERWEQCQRVLEAMPEHERRHHFDMANFGMETACGTVACAAGHCALDPWFQSRGFAMTRCQGSECSDRNCKIYILSLSIDRFFGLKGSQSIFMNMEPRSVETVIEEVKAHIASLKARVQS